MRKAAMLFLFAWYFVQSDRMMGPFDTKERCEEVYKLWSVKRTACYCVRNFAHDCG